MFDLRMAMQHNLDVLGVGRTLVDLGHAFLRDYPDPYRLARKHGARILREHTGRDWDPDQVWWHEFENAHSSPRTFTGWAHGQAPVKSMRFTQLVVERFKLAFQEAPDLLDSYGGFYRHGPRADFYDERNEVKIGGQAVQQAFWQLDFAREVQQQVKAFWAARSEDFRVLAKVSLLAGIQDAQHHEYIDQNDCRRLRALAATETEPVGKAITLQLLRQHVAGSELTIDSYHPNGAGRVWMYVLRSAHGRTLLYMPYDPQPLRGFESAVSMAAWFRALLRTKAGLQRVLSGMVADPGLTVQVDDAREALQRVADSADAQAVLAGMEATFRRRSGDFFAVLAEDCAQNMRENAELLVSNWLLREAIASDYLSVVVRFAIYFTPLMPGLSLLILASSLAKVYLDADLAVHARTREARDANVLSGVVDAIFSALGMVEVNASGQVARASLVYRPSYHEVDAVVEGWQQVPHGGNELVGLEDNAVIFGEPAGEQNLAGIHFDADGTCRIELDGQPYQVRYSPELKHWLIIDPQNPYAFAPVRPVRLSETGQWELLQPPRLAGGAPGARPSPFWDEYMRTDEARSEALSEAAEQRHVAMLDDESIYELPEDREPMVDDEDFDYADEDGYAHYTFKHDGRYKNHLVDIYTVDDSINAFLREGKRDFDYGDPVAYLDKLLDSLEGLPINAERPLFRGGHGERATSGAHFRSGEFKVGDVLVNTDLTSFTENPYIIRKFAADMDRTASSGLSGVFDDSSVVFELPAQGYESGVQVTALSGHKYEAETLFAPGAYFRIDAIEELQGADYQFVNVRLRQVHKPAGGLIRDLRTGLPFDRQAYVERLGSAELVNRLFPI